MSGWQRSGARALRAGALVVVALTAATIAWPPSTAHAETPSWADVQDARNDEAAAASLLSRIDAALDEAQQRSELTATAALDAARAATAAQELAETAATRAAAFDAQVTAAETDAAARRDEVGMLASSLYRTQTDAPLIARLLTAAEPEDLLDRLSLLDVMGSAWAGRAAQAQSAAQVVVSLRDQAATAHSAREDAAAEAERAASDARSAADAEAATVSGLSTQVDTLYAQLAALRGTTADLERRYRLDAQVAAQPANPAPGGSAPATPSAPSVPGGGAPAVPAPSPPAPPVSPGVVVDPAGAQAYARGAIGRYGWADDQFGCLVALWNRESGWRADALNRSSGAYGIPQAWPAEKMASAGSDWRTNAATQVDWGLSYISGRYGSPCGAWDHSERVGWY